MKVPYRIYAYVPRDKIEKYLISLIHPVGKYKAVVFRSRGFDESNMDLLEEELLKIIRSCEVANTSIGPLWENYVVNGSIRAPDGRVINLKTAWTVDNGKKAPRLVSAYPL